jgi:putative MATE family efflux protein
MNEKNDFSQGSVWKNIVNLAIPMTLAQLINVLYNIVDRIYIGHIQDASTGALTGVGLALPIITIITAFANMFGMGGAPLCSIARGAHEDKKAEDIMGTAFTMLVITGVILTILFECFHKPLLYLFGASAETISFASSYITIYLIGTVFVMISLGMNNFITSQGFGKIGMLTVLTGAILNIILEPIFIFTLGMGVKGSAIATVISQGVSSLCVLGFLISKKALLRISISSMKISLIHLKEIVSLGMSGFVMYVSTGIVQIVCNATLAHYGGDLYIGILTILTSVREVVYMPLTGFSNGAQPVISYNYGAKQYSRVKSSILFMTACCFCFAFVGWTAIKIFPQAFIHLFNSEPEMLKAGVPAMNLYFWGLFMAAFQFSGQFTFVALGKSGWAIFFSSLRKILIVVPLTLLLPLVRNLGTDGVFLAEPISNFISGASCYITMYFTVWRKLQK